MDRDEFIQLMIAELNRQREADVGFTNPPKATASEVYRKLCYDYPDTTSDELLTLASAIDSVVANSEQSVWSSTAAPLPVALHFKLLENLHYLCSSTQAEEDKEFAAAVGQLNATIYLKIPAFLLSCRKRQLNRIFSTSRLPTLYEIESSTDGGQELAGPTDEVANLSWAEISQRFCSFVKSGSASCICTGMQPGVVFSSGSRSALMSGGHVSAACAAIKRLGQALHASSEQADGGVKVGDTSGVQQRCLQGLESPDGLDTLEDYLRAQALLKPRSDDEDNEGAGEGVEGERGEEDESPINSCKDAWVNLCFLLRDAVVHAPILVVDGSFLALLTALHEAVPAPAPTAASDFPSASECLRVLVFSSVSASILAPLPSPAGTGTTGGAAEASGDSAHAAEYKTGQLRLAARGSLRTHLDRAQGLEGLVDACERMARKASDGGAEAAGLLGEVCGLYLQGLPSAARTSTLHERLVASRALALLASVLVKAWTSAPPPSSVAYAANAPAPPSRAPPASARLQDLLTMAALQSPDTASYLLRLPGFSPALLGNGVDPATRVPLSVGLLVGLAGSGSSVRVAPFEAIRALLLQTLEELAASVRAYAAEPEEDGSSGPDREGHNENGEEDDNDDAASVARNVAATPKRLPPRLVSCLALAVESGAEALQALARADAALKQELLQWCAGVLRAAEGAKKGKLDDAKKVCKALKSVLEGWSNKTD